MSLSEAPIAARFFSMVPWIVLFPVLGLLINAVFGGRFKEKTIGIIACTASGLSFLVSLLQWIGLTHYPEGASMVFLDWIKIGTLDVGWTFRVDTLAVTMMLVVSGVGTLIHVYATGYMHYDVRYKEDTTRYRRFFVFMNLFIAAMMILVGGDNYLMLFVGWEGVGLCSFLLIGFWYDKNLNGTPGTENAMAAKKAFVTNRVGDFGFLMAGFLMFWYFGTLQFDGVFEQVHQVSSGVILAITLFMLLGVAGKSAQIPLYVWLPDAMAGPTPVSALIHAATMVTAGVYLVARSAPLYQEALVAQHAVALVGAITALFAATIAVGQYDIKRVLAYSTISQLGFMVAAVGIGAYVAGMFHLVTHAFFKALLFLGSGSVILGVERGHHPLDHAPDDSSHHKEEKHQVAIFDPQDMRNMGGLRHKMPLTFWVYIIGALALAGIPPLAGFWSKDEILADANAENSAVYILLTIAAFLTAFYMGRQIWLVFFGAPRTHAAEHAKESPPAMTIPLLVLAGLSVIGGGLNLPGLHSLTGWLEHTLGHAAHAGEFNLVVAMVSTTLGVFAVLLSWLLYARKPYTHGAPDPLRRLLGPVFVGMNRKWWVDELYWAVILNPYIKLAEFLADKVDWKFWHDWFHDTIVIGTFKTATRFFAGPVDLGIIDGVANAIGNQTQRLSRILRRIQTGYVRNYALSVFLGVVLIIGYLVFT